MAFQIPPRAIKSFSKKQLIDSFYRLLCQMDSAPLGSLNWQENKVIFQKYLQILKNHETKEIAALAPQLLENFPDTKENLQLCLMMIERWLEKDLPEDHFLITTQDTEERKKDEFADRLSINLLLDNLRSSFNVGSLFRSGEAFSVEHIYLCGYTATPENSKTTKSALGSDQWTNWSHHEDTLEVLDQLKKQGSYIIAMETVSGSENLEQWLPDYSILKNYRNIVVVLGNERYGLSTPSLKRADKILKINLTGRKNSLNVGVCGAIVLNHIRTIESNTK